MVAVWDFVSFFIVFVLFDCVGWFIPFGLYKGGTAKQGIQKKDTSCGESPVNRWKAGMSRFALPKNVPHQLADGGRSVERNQYLVLVRGNRPTNDRSGLYFCWLFHVVCVGLVCA